ncbi:monosaccharide ABC transporter substrate-binding protein, CUT2 family [Pseudooceanicola nitratireducens]|jgi:ribose transport system substrate-binding protein|uniref:Monosaccharide ABC transporter substrate-binding protein, CUT2 family n=1 Tax=Pseudooceanicola nitratireducens TaxID=517719 RepID=A0A1I1Q5E6_9RHOB|nr:ABC transporter substrate-binding protein [Pseudooceanicola nitratireducens]SEJ69818.1 ribose transport system substrate-binding protein [Pseudooceanicola nitratireducens]SFD15068.1 monosaccharide ABC transporter substrate-binding protein, CUT2 family [Pseudooceanicola nitratireducens]
MSKFIKAASVMSLLGATATVAHAEEFTIGLSNGWVGSEWRTQMIAEAEEAAKAWADKGVTVTTKVQSANVDVPGQIAHVRNFISQGVDAIIINPNSPTAFDPVFAEAADAGILVIATDAEVSSPDAIYVGIDQKGWAEMSARWLAETLDGKGTVVAINGVAGHPANEMRVAGYQEVFGEFPGIEIVNEVNGNWDQAQGQQAMQNILATYPDIDGVWVQDGMAAGAWRAMQDAGRDDIYATGEIRKDFIDIWSENSLKSGASVNPPGVMASALNVAVNMLMGKELKEPATAGVYGNAMYLPIPFISDENLGEASAALEGQPGYTSYTSSLSIDDATALFD